MNTIRVGITIIHRDPLTDEETDLGTYIGISTTDEDYEGIGRHIISELKRIERKFEINDNHKIVRRGQQP